jgi:hypothetical protein
MATRVHQCPRCELRFVNTNELRDHFALDHAADPSTFDRFRYPQDPRAGTTATRRVLVVANQTLGGEHLDDAVRSRAEAGDTSFFVLVPATHSAHHESPPSGAAAVADEASGADDVGLALARWRLRSTIDRLHAAGVEVEGVVGDPDPYTAVTRLLADHSFDEIILSTLPSGASRWLSVDLPGRLERRSGVPVTTLVGYAGH